MPTDKWQTFPTKVVLSRREGTLSYDGEKVEVSQENFSKRVIRASDTNPKRRRGSSP